MKLGCSTITYQLGGISIHDSLERIKALEIDYVDFPGFDAHQPQFYSTAEKLRISKRLEQLDMHANSIIYLPKANPGSFSLEERLAAIEEIKPAARFLKEMGGRFVIFCESCGRPDYATNLDRDQAYENSIDTTKRFCEWAEKEGINVMLELIPYGGNFYKIERMKDTLDRVGAPNLWANIDLGHCYLQKIHGKRFSALGDRAVSVHISDNDAVGNEGCVCEADMIIGKGNTDFKSYFHYLQKMDIDGNCKKAGFGEAVATIECVEDEFIPNPDYCILRSRDYILSQVPGLFLK